MQQLLAGPDGSVRSESAECSYPSGRTYSAGRSYPPERSCPPGSRTIRSRSDVFRDRERARADAGPFPRGCPAGAES